MDQFLHLWFNFNMRGKMLDAKAGDQSDKVMTSFHEDYSTKNLNLNDLLQRRQEEKRQDKKNNIIIFSGVTAFATIVVLVLSL